MESPGLVPHSKLPIYNTANILIVGDFGVGKHQLARILVKQATNFSVHVRTATSLPLPESNAERRPSIDLVLFMIDLTVIKSMKVVEDSLRLLDVNFFLGRVALVITNVSHQMENGVPISLVMELAALYDCPVLPADLQTGSGCHAISQQLLTVLRIPSGMHPFISPLLVGATLHDSNLTL